MPPDPAVFCSHPLSCTSNMSLWPRDTVRSVLWPSTQRLKGGRGLLVRLIYSFNECINIDVVFVGGECGEIVQHSQPNSLIHAELVLRDLGVACVTARKFDSVCLIHRISKDLATASSFTPNSHLRLCCRSAESPCLKESKHEAR